MAMEETPICVNQSMTVLVFQLQIPGIVISKIFADEYTVVLQEQLIQPTKIVILQPCR